MHRFSLQGSVFWMAPEVVKQSGHTLKADIWSVGCLVVEMLTGEHPWAQLTQMQAIFKVSYTLPVDLPLFLIVFCRSDHQLDLVCPLISPQKLSTSWKRLLYWTKMHGHRHRNFHNIPLLKENKRLWLWFPFYKILSWPCFPFLLRLLSTFYHTVSALCCSSFWSNLRMPSTLIYCISVLLLRKCLNF